MEALPYIPLKTVLYDISTMIETKEWNEANMLEWAYRALRKNKSTKVYTTKVALLNCIEHKFPLPKDLRYVHQIAYKICSYEQALEDIKEQLGLDTDQFVNSTIPYSALTSMYTSGVNRWRPLRLSSTPFALSIHCGHGIPFCQNCEHDYTVSEDMVVTTSLKEGLILVSYMAYPQSEDGEILMPDNPDLRDAIMHYCLYRYYMSKSLKAMGTDQYADRQKEWHLTMYETLSAKSSGSMNLPSIDSLENMRRWHNRLVPRERQYDQFLMGLNKSEIIKNV